MLRLENVQGSSIEPHLDAMGALRITVFRDFPYLYDGNLDYERAYMQTYVDDPQCLAVLAFHGHAVVGMTTCLPLMHADPAFRGTFMEHGWAPESVCYLGESVLLPQYRGRGLGKQFFKRRESHALSLGLKAAAFCAVDRPANHPLRPKDYMPLDKFWLGQGYKRQDDMKAVFSWKEIQEKEETPKTLTFWTKTLA